MRALGTRQRTGCHACGARTGTTVASRRTRTLCTLSEVSEARCPSEFFELFLNIHFVAPCSAPAESIALLTVCVSFISSGKYCSIATEHEAMC